MSKFRKKPVVVEACKAADAIVAVKSKWTNLPLWLRDACERGDVLFATPNGISEIHIHTLEGWLTAKHEDWIIRGVKGELYPCKPDIFEATYEPVP